MEADEALLEAWRAGDRRAGSELFHRHVGCLVRFFSSKLDRGIDDLVQRTLLKCTEVRDAVRESSSFRAYLLAIARTELLMHLRSSARDGVRFDPLTSSVADIATSPSRAVLGRERQRLIVDALRRIPVELQIALELHYWEGLSASELADVLDIPLGSVKTRLRRAKEHLRAELGPTRSRPDEPEGF
jgi:RNA polymerase sigma factor (sigma-70 family)